MTVHPQPTLPLGYRADIAQWSAAPLSTPYSSLSSEYSTSMFGSSSAALSVPHFGPSHRRSRYVSSSSSSSTSHSLTRILPRKRHLVSSYSTPPSFDGPSHKRCRSHTTSLPVATLALAVLSYVPVDRLPPRYRFRVEDKLDEQSKMIKCMYEDLLDMPLSRIEVRAADLTDESFRVSLGIVSTRLAEMRCQVKDTAEQLQQCQIDRINVDDKTRNEFCEEQADSTPTSSNAIEAKAGKILINFPKTLRSGIPGKVLNSRVNVKTSSKEVSAFVFPTQFFDQIPPMAL
ncbi:hypothetical protein Tco_0727045 [Tanacetum coccineum]|uniref:Uncharacterized protein n=1 Tax=Tanacetum coccineum TaxID=301880 RepID=A0ABQ4YHA1_9ASTR